MKLAATCFPQGKPRLIGYNVSLPRKIRLVCQAVPSPYSSLITKGRAATLDAWASFQAKIINYCNPNNSFPEKSLLELRPSARDLRKHYCSRQPHGLISPACVPDPPHSKASFHLHRSHGLPLQTSPIAPNGSWLWSSASSLSSPKRPYTLSALDPPRSIQLA